MPIYSYQCKKCHHIFEQLVGVTANSDELACPQCGHSEVEKKISGFAVGSPSVKPASGGTCSGGSCCPTC